VLAASLADRMALNFTRSSASDCSAINGLDPDDLNAGEIDGPAPAIQAFEFLLTVLVLKILHRRPAAAARHPRTRASWAAICCRARRAPCASFYDSDRLQMAGDLIPCRGRFHLHFPADPGNARFNELPLFAC